MQKTGIHFIIKNIRAMSVANLTTFLWLGIQHPWRMMKTLWASIQTLQICQQLFDNEHFGHGKPNAYRHALWNYLIAQQTASYDWTKNFTEKYEQLFPNHPIDRQMDLHNNEIGRRLFLLSPNLNREELKKEMDLLYQQAQLLDFKNFNSEKLISEMFLVYY